VLDIGGGLPAKAFSLPVSTMALVESSLSKARRAAFSSLKRVVESAFRAFGRLRVTGRVMLYQ